MTLVPNETEQALNHQYDVYAAAREEYRKKIDEQAARIERLEAALRKIASSNQQRSNCFCGACIQARAARAALEGE